MQLSFFATELDKREEAKVALSILPKLEMEYGIATCEPSDMPGNYQWGYPNGWPPLQRIVVQALLNYGYKEDAVRIASKYADVVEHNFVETGHLWEKYNVADGSVRVVNEYEMNIKQKGGVALMNKNLLVRQHFCFHQTISKCCIVIN